MSTKTTARDVVAALMEKMPSQQLRMRQGSVVSVQADSTVTVTIGGSAVQISGVKVMSGCCPKPGASAWFTTDGRDLIMIGHLAPVGPAYARVRKGTNQSVASGTDAVLTFTSVPAELDDPWGMFDAGSPTRLTVKVPGLYVVSFSYQWDGDVDGRRVIHLMKNGTDFASETKSPSSTSVLNGTITSVVPAAIGDYFEVDFYHTAGNVLALVGGTADRNLLTATYLGPA